MRIYIAKTDKGLMPAYNSDKEKIAKLKNGIHPFELKIERNPRHHALVFAMARCTLDNTEGPWGEAYQRNREATVVNFIKAVMMEIGMMEISMRLDGSAVAIVKSLKFSEMNESEFQPLSDAISEKCAEVLKVDADTFRKNYMDYL